MPLPDSAPVTPGTTGRILPADMPLALERFEDIALLSLDCFDTLLWRDCHAPGDLFAALPGATPVQRAHAESTTRLTGANLRGRRDVRLGEIYRTLMPGADVAALETAVSQELVTEARHCYAFAPTVALMQAAKARGIPIILVSDTYLDKDELRWLIAHSAGPEVADLIDRIFCSCTYDRPKGAGLFSQVLAQMDVAPGRVLHIGDNARADVAGVAPFGVHTLHLVQFENDVQRQLRLEAGAGRIAMPPRAGQKIIASPQPHRPTLALATPAITDEAERMGACVLGPLLTGFDNWLRTEAAALQQARGGTVHWAFMMRDGHMPMLAHLARAPNPHAAALEVSRFTAMSASYSSAAELHAYAEHLLVREPRSVARQLLIPEDTIDTLHEGLTPHVAARNTGAYLRHPLGQAQVLDASAAMAQRLVAHVRKALDPQPGDTIMLVDVGYNGSAQNRLAPLLERELGVHVAGRYLMLLEKEVSGLDKRGLLDLDHLDETALQTLIAPASLFDQLFSSGLGSVVDYTEAGEPIRAEPETTAQQHAVRQRIQAGAMRFITAHDSSSQRLANLDMVERWRRAAAAIVTRVLYLPTEKERQILAGFAHDVNMATGRVNPLFDPEAAAQGLRRRGLFHVCKGPRPYLAAELQGHGMPLQLSLLAVRRFELPLRYADLCDRTFPLPVVYVNGDKVTPVRVMANPTHDGFFLVAIPLGTHTADHPRFGIAIQLGRLFEWVELEHVSLMPVHDFNQHYTGGEFTEHDPEVYMEGIHQVAPRLLHCTSSESMLLFPPATFQPDTDLMAMMVFRPVVERPPVDAATPTG